MSRLEARLLPDGPGIEVDAGDRIGVADPRLVDLVAGARGAPRGEVRLDGTVVPPRRSAAARARLGIVTIVDAPVAPDVAVVEHLTARVSRVAATEALASCPLLAGRGDLPAGVLSGGERRALAWLRAAVLAPRVVVLRDATVGLDPETRRWSERLLEGWQARGAAVLDG